MNIAISSFGPRRSKATRKPSVLCPEVVFHRCAVCHALVQVVNTGAQECPIDCCGRPMERLVALSPDRLPAGMLPDYQIVGSLNENALRIIWNAQNPAARPEWIYLKTFTGGQLMYLTEKKRPPAVFALADEDAYAYCDKDPCVECSFRCKRGFVLYCYFTALGLAELPLERISSDLRGVAARTNETP